MSEYYLDCKGVGGRLCPAGLRSLGTLLLQLTKEIHCDATTSSGDSTTLPLTDESSGCLQQDASELSRSTENSFLAKVCGICVFFCWCNFKIIQNRIYFLPTPRYSSRSCIEQEDLSRFSAGVLSECESKQDKRNQDSADFRLEHPQKRNCRGPTIFLMK